MLSSKPRSPLARVSAMRQARQSDQLLFHKMVAKEGNSSLSFSFIVSLSAALSKPITLSVRASMCCWQ